ncbi:hypothetical protein K3495_g16754, partial [Podosphaera aphanis]
MEQDVQSEIQNFMQKASDDQNTQKPENLSSYYQRAVNLLRRAHCRDHPRESSALPGLTGLENLMLNTIINAFVVGLHNPRLRQKVLEKDGATCGALWKAQEIIQSAQRSIDILDQTEKELVEKARLSRLEEFVSSQYGRPATSVLADVEAGKFVYSLNQQSNLTSSTKRVTPPTGTIPPSRQLPASANFNREYHPSGAEKKPPNS